MTHLENLKNLFNNHLPSTPITSVKIFSATNTTIELFTAEMSEQIEENEIGEAITQFLEAIEALKTHYATKEEVMKDLTEEMENIHPSNTRGLIF